MIYCIYILININFVGLKYMYLGFSKNNIFIVFFNNKKKNGL